MNFWYNMSVANVEKKLETSSKDGLDKKESLKRIKKVGLNKLKEVKKQNVFFRFLLQFKDFMVLILLACAIVSFALGEVRDATIIFIILLANAIIGLIQEGKAEKSIQALQKLTTHKAKVIRSGKMEVISSEYLVPGDLVILEAGDLIPADIRLIESKSLAVQEASFTGETIPVNKNIATINNTNITLGDMKNMVFSSSLVTYGRGSGIVVSTGMNSEIGKIANYIQSESIQDTPLKRKLETLGKVLGIVAIGICIVIFLMGIFIYNMEIFEIFLVAISLAVAAIPEGLPAVATIVLAIGVQRMAKRKAIIRKLPSVETLGCTTVICSDKTGTLTQNVMTVKEIYIDNRVILFNKNANVNNSLKDLTITSILCNDTKILKKIGSNSILGDPTETALVNMGFDINIDKSKIDKQYPRINEIPFDSNRKCMITINEMSGEYVANLKGGVDEVLKKCNKIYINGRLCDLDKSYLDKIYNANVYMTSKALRVLAIAKKTVDRSTANGNLKDNMTGFEFIGLVGMIDPPRPGVKEAIAKCKNAGIKTIMITGDHKITATTIAKELGILYSESEAITGSDLDKLSESEFSRKVKQYSVYARVSPEHKVKIVKALKEQKEIVAMTGDGINDAPALKNADIGIAMGVIGTDVAKEASDMILANDNFSTIVSAVEEGRRIYDNILKSIKFLLSCNTGEIFTIFFAMLFGMAEPFLPIHILWINLVTDCLPALALGVDPADEDIMKRKPIKNNASIFSKHMLSTILLQGFTIAMATLTAFYIGLKVDIATAQTMAFAVLGFSQLTHSFNVHANKGSVFSKKVFSNRKLILANIISGMFMVVVMFIPFLREIFSFAILSTENLINIVLLSLVPIAVVEIIKKFTKK